MVAVKAYYNGRVFVPESPVSANINQEAIVTFLETESINTSQKDRLFSLAGSISHEDYLEMEKALEDTERVHPNEW